MSAQKPIIMYDAPEAASLQTVTGWVSSGGRFFGDDENLARHCGATHRRCEVNPEYPIYEVNSSCDECRHVRRQAKFAAMPVKDCAGEPLVIFDGDRYLFEKDDLRDYSPNENGLLREALRCQGLHHGEQQGLLRIQPPLQRLHLIDRDGELHIRPRPACTEPKGRQSS
ncbi:hypothetical protein [Pseudomonas sp. B33.4]|uniref:hypothetical protein n=1 Tax=Pseudomonas sp. B33.4 TaxID=3104265 RepID=UPI002ADEA988|nr:hypothetical protein [Pseudomonas sp. B33.4]